MKKRITSLLLALCLALGLAPVLPRQASAAEPEYEQAWYPATHMYVVQIAYESYSHLSYNTMDIANITGLSKEEKRVFAPFTGVIVYNDTQNKGTKYKNFGNYGYVLLQSLDKVRYADGTVDYMTVGFMHDADISDLPQGKVIKQGEFFYDHGGMGNGNPKAYSSHVEVTVFRGRFRSLSGPNSDGSYNVGNWLRKFNEAKKQNKGSKSERRSHGDLYAFDAFSVNTARTKTSLYTSVGYKLDGNTMGGKNAPSDWSGKWKDLNGNPFPAVPTLSGCKAPGALKVGEKYSVTGTVSSKSKLLSVTVGVYTSETGGTMKTGKTVTPSNPQHGGKFTRVKSYQLSKLDSAVQFNKLPAGTYWYRITAKNGGGTVTLMNAKFTVGNVASPSKPDTGSTAAPPAQSNTPSQSPSAQSPAQSAPLPAGTTERPSWWPSQTTETENTDNPQHPALGWYTLTPACAPGLRLDVAYSGTSNEDTVWTWGANGTPAQLWYVHPNQDTDYFYNIRAGVDPDIKMCLDVQYGGLTSGTPVWQYEENGTQAQDWMFLDAGDGYYYIVPRENQDLTLAIKNGSAEECGELIIETRNGSSGQKWLLTKYG